MKGSPASLYVTTVRHVAKNFDRFASLDLSRHLTESMRFDIYWDIFAASSPATTSTSLLKDPYRRVRRRLIRELGRFDVFFALLNVGHRRMQLHNMFQVIEFWQYSNLGRSKVRQNLYLEATTHDIIIKASVFMLTASLLSLC
jgi:hypothetical protein